MVGDYSLFERFAKSIECLPSCIPLTREILLAQQFRLYKDSELEIYYVPFDYVNTEAKVVLVGITPGFTQMEIAYREARAGLLNGRPIEEIFKRTDGQASFAGEMRKNLINMLDGIGLAEALHIESSEALFSSHAYLAHSTSVVRYATFKKGRDGKLLDYTGYAPRLLAHPVLRGCYAQGLLLDELRSIGRTLIVPLGTCVSDVMQELVEKKLLAREQCLLGFPHPSGANGHRKAQYNSRRDGSERKVREWFERVTEAEE